MVNLKYTPLHNNMRLQGARVRVSLTADAVQQVEARLTEALAFLDTSDCNEAHPTLAKQIAAANAEARRLRGTLLALEETLAVAERF